MTVTSKLELAILHALFNRKYKMTQNVITKNQLITQLTAWHEKKISSETLQDWMVTHYDPPEVEIGQGETQWVEEAMNIIMNEYELAKIEKFKPEGYQFAMAFLNCEEDNFLVRRQQFIHDSFLD